MLLKRLGITALLLIIYSAPAYASPFDFMFGGYFRNRVVMNQDLDLQKPNNSLPHSNNRFSFIQYNQMRLRLMPGLKIGDHITIHTQIDCLDNILFGTKDTVQVQALNPMVGVQEPPAGAGSVSMTGGIAGENGAINFRRAWVDIFTPIGKFRLGRQPSNWGMGIFANDGNAPDDDFGDTGDRIMYALGYPLSDVDMITAAIIWDIAYEAQVDPRIDGLSDGIRSNSQDTQQYAAMIMYERPEVTIGLFGGARRRNGPECDNCTMTAEAVDTSTASGLGAPQAAGIDGNTLIYFTDLFARFQYENYKFQFEGVYVGGKITTGLAIDAVPFSSLTDGQGIIELPRDQSLQIFMAAFQADASYDWGGSWKFQTGYAPGDNDPMSMKLTQYGFRPDYQIALMMFHVPMGTAPSLYDNSSGRYLTGGKSITGNYVNNSLYFTMGYKHTFNVSRALPGVDWIKIGTKLITAFCSM